MMSMLRLVLSITASYFHDKIFSYLSPVMLILFHLFVQQLKGLEDLFKYAAKHMEVKSYKWRDLNVTNWKREECIKGRLQTDGYAS